MSMVLLDFTNFLDFFILLAIFVSGSISFGNLYNHCSVIKIIGINAFGFFSIKGIIKILKNKKQLFKVVVVAAGKTGIPTGSNCLVVMTIDTNGDKRG